MISFTDFSQNKLESGLYVVSTPIGNLSDVSFRAIEVLSKSDYIFAKILEYQKVIRKI